MKSKLIVIATFLALFYSLDAYSQASWRFSILFNIYDKDGRKFDAEDFENKNIQALSAKFGYHANEEIYYDKDLEAFCFSQGTIVSSSRLVFKIKDEWMQIEFPTHNIFLDKIIFESGVFSLGEWRNEKDYDCNINIPPKYGNYCKPKLELSEYKNRDKDFISEDHLEEVEIIIK